MFQILLCFQNLLFTCINCFLNSFYEVKVNIGIKNFIFLLMYLGSRYCLFMCFFKYQHIQHSERKLSNFTSMQNNKFCTSIDQWRSKELFKRQFLKNLILLKNLSVNFIFGSIFCL